VNQLVSIESIGDVLKRHQLAQRAAIVRGMKSGARRGQPILVRVTPKDRGQAKAAWTTVIHGDSGVLAENVNSAPYIGVLECGSRPHKVSWEGIFSIYQWIERHFRLSSGGALQAGAKGTRLTNRSSRAFKLAQTPALGHLNGGEAIGRHGSYVAKAILETHPEYAGRLVPAACNITGAIVWKLMTKGQAPRWFVRNAMEELNKALRDEIERCMAEIKPGGRS
jgi:hypothetical protein